MNRCESGRCNAGRGAQAVGGADAALEAGNEPGSSQFAEVVVHWRLSEVDRRRASTDADLLRRRVEHGSICQDYNAHYVAGKTSAVEKRPTADPRRNAGSCPQEAQEISVKTIRTLLLTAALGSAVAACGSGSGTASQATSTASPTAFVLQEWSITAPTSQIRASNVHVTATNRGSETHELVIVRADDAASLPTKSDGSVDEDKIAEADKPGEIPDLKAGSTVTKTIDLPPGKYVAICNLVDTMGNGGTGGMGQGGGMGGGQMGHVHYRLGMVVRFAVV